MCVGRGERGCVTPKAVAGCRFAMPFLVCALGRARAAAPANGRVSLLLSCLWGSEWDDGGRLLWLQTMAHRSRSCKRRRQEKRQQVSVGAVRAVMSLCPAGGARLWHSTRLPSWTEGGLPLDRGERNSGEAERAIFPVSRWAQPTMPPPWLFAQGGGRRRGEQLANGESPTGGRQPLIPPWPLKKMSE